MTPAQTAELESLVAAIRDVDARFDPALEAQKAANDDVDALTAESEAARQAYETFMWQLKDDPDLLNPAVADPALTPDGVDSSDAPPVVPVDGPEVAPVDALTAESEAAPADPPLGITDTPSASGGAVMSESTPTLGPVSRTAN